MRKKNLPQYHFQKHPNTRGSHPHAVTLLQIMKFTLRREKKKKPEEDLLRKGSNLGTEE